MVFTLSSQTTNLTGVNVWIIDGRREICITYTYYPGSGDVTYAASVFRKDNTDEQLTLKQVAAHEHTTSRRFAMRPVYTSIGEELNGLEILRAIRYEMCHGAGCKGVRPGWNRHMRNRTTAYPESVDDCSSTSSGESFLSTNSEDFQVSPSIKRLRRLHRHRVIVPGNGEFRNIFLVFKGRSQNGETLYGASICRQKDNDEALSDDVIDAHFETATSRINRNPVHFRVSEENRPRLVHTQMGPGPSGYTTSFTGTNHMPAHVLEMIDNIFRRKGGKLQVRNY